MTADSNNDTDSPKPSIMIGGLKKKEIQANRMLKSK